MLLEYSTAADFCLKVGRCAKISGGQEGVVISIFEVLFEKKEGCSLLFLLDYPQIDPKSTRQG